jgi:hypothetical protein
MNEILEYEAMVERYSQGENRGFYYKSHPRITYLTLRGLILNPVPFCVFEFRKSPRRYSKQLDCQQIRPKNRRNKKLLYLQFRRILERIFKEFLVIFSPDEKPEC